ncbi:MAG: ABC transporter permease [Culicoidibacterales bacterium]
MEISTTTKFIFIFLSSLAYASPIIFAGIGGLYSEKSGVVNIGLEGMMVIGAFSAAMVSNFYGQALGSTGVIIVSFLAAGIAGGLFALLHAIASITFRANQIISGTALNMLSVSLCVFLVKLLFDGIAQTPGSNVTYSMDLYIAGFPLNIGFIMVLITTIATAFILYNTRFGLRLRAVGENPSAVDTAGISVYKMRYIGVILSGVLAGIGGALTILTFANGRFSALTISGLGFLALASLVFGKWKPWGVFGAAIFFGFSRNLSETAISNFPQIIEYIPGVALKILPYVLTIVALVVFSRSAVAPKASGIPYDKGER